MMNRVRILVLAASALQAQSVVSTGNMLWPHWLPTTTVLSDGHVLATGGYSTGTGALGEIFDPTTGTWSATGPMTVPRAGHASILLDDGRVLLAGGGGVTADLFDPVTRTFSFAGDTSSAYLHPAVKLRGGRILLVAMTNDSTALADIFDPATNAWARLPPMEAGIPIGLPDGRVVVVGRSSALIYRVDPASLQPLVRHDLGTAIAGSAVMIGDGRILLAGGPVSYAFGHPSHTSAIYDPRRGTVSPTGAYGALYVDLVPLRNGAVLVTSGANSYLDSSTEVPAVYEPATGVFTKLPFLPTGRAAAALLDGRVLLAGTDGNAAVPPSWLFTPDARVVSAASLAARVAPGSLATLFGSQIGSGTSVVVTDRLGTAQLATILYSSVTQINLVIPQNLAPGSLRLVIQRPGAPDLQADLDAATVAPGLFQFEDGTAAAYAQRREPNGTSTLLDVRQPVSLDIGPVSLVLLGTGIRNRTTIGNVTCTIGGITVGVDYAGPEGSGLEGLDQINVRLPDALRGRGSVLLSLKVDGVESNSVTLEIR